MYNYLKFRRERERRASTAESSSVKIDQTSSCNFEQYYNHIKPLYYQLFYLLVKMYRKSFSHVGNIFFSIYLCKFKYHKFEFFTILEERKKCNSNIDLIKWWMCGDTSITLNIGTKITYILYRYNKMWCHLKIYKRLQGINDFIKS